MRGATGGVLLIKGPALSTGNMFLIFIPFIPETDSSVMSLWVRRMRSPHEK
jgi:hypothetical protein